MSRIGVVMAYCCEFNHYQRPSLLMQGAVAVIMPLLNQRYFALAVHTTHQKSRHIINWQQPDIVKMNHPKPIKSITTR